MTSFIDFTKDLCIKHLQNYSIDIQLIKCLYCAVIFFFLLTITNQTYSV